MLARHPDLDVAGEQGRRWIVASDVEQRRERMHIDDGLDMSDRQRMANRILDQRARDRRSKREGSPRERARKSGERRPPPSIGLGVVQETFCRVLCRAEIAANVAL